MKKLSFALVFLSIIFSACEPRDKSGKILDNPTSGNIRIAVDETFKPVMEQEVMVFTNLYKDAKVEAIYLSEKEGYDLLMKDSVRLMIGSRKLNESEMAYFKQKQITPRTTKVAYDAIALILNNANPDTFFAWDELQQIFSGQMNEWKQMNKDNPHGPINIVFDNNGSSTASFIMQRFGLEKLPANVFASKGNQETIDYVAANPNALGIIGVNWISDGKDSSALGFQNIINVASVSALPKNTALDYMRPYQAFMADSLYPLTRELYVLSREYYDGLGTGFTSFVAGDKGQRIILKSGLLPATMPVRLVEIKKGMN